MPSLDSSTGGAKPQVFSGWGEYTLCSAFVTLLTQLLRSTKAVGCFFTSRWITVITRVTSNSQFHVDAVLRKKSKTWMLASIASRMSVPFEIHVLVCFFFWDHFWARFIVRMNLQDCPFFGQKLLNWKSKPGIKKNILARHFLFWSMSMVKMLKI